MSEICSSVVMMDYNQQTNKPKSVITHSFICRHVGLQQTNQPTNQTPKIKPLTTYFYSFEIDLTYESMSPSSSE